MESIRVIMLRNWHFDILNMEHWQIAWDLWQNSWVISEPKEWAFVLIIVSFIPLWFTGWIALSLISWGKLFWFILTLPWKLFKAIFYKPVKIITTNTGVTPIKKKRSYKEIRPRAVRPVTMERSELSPTPITIPTITPTLSVPQTITPIKKSKAEAEAASSPKNFEHALFKFDDNFDDLDFDIDSFEVEPQKDKAPKEERSERPSRNSDNDYNDSYNPKEKRDRKENSGRNRDDGYRDDDRRKERDNDRREDRRSERNRDSERKDNFRDERRDRDTDKRDNRRDKDRREDNRDRDRDNDRKKERPTTQVGTRQPTGSCLDIIKQKGYEVISRATIKNTVIDYIGISNDRICLCLLDREPGDWLADEERFNDEEPLWFSESSHRISPVRKIDLAKQALLDKLDMAELNFKVDAYVIEQIGNIINAEDMFDIWDSLNVNVTRIDRGTPKEIKLFARALPDAEKSIAPSKLDKVMKIIRSMS